jgi:hypothetical protein
MVRLPSRNHKTMLTFPVDAVQSANIAEFAYEFPTSLGTDFPNLFDFHETSIQSTHPGDHALIVDTSSPILNNPATILDWAFPSFISQSSPDTVPGDKFQDLLNTSQGVDACNPMIMMNTGPADLFQSMPENQGSARAARAAKQQKLLEIQETARRLEAELAAT